MAAGREAQRRPRKAGVPWWVWLVLSGVGLLSLLGCCGTVGAVLLVRGGWIADMMQSPYNPRVTEQNYERIHPGMTAAEVKAILGEPNATAAAYREAEEDGDDPRSYGGRLMRWKNGDYCIDVTLNQEGQVTDVGYHSP